MKKVSYKVEVKVEKKVCDDGSYCDFCGRHKQTVFIAPHNDDFFICEFCVRVLSKL